MDIARKRLRDIYRRTPLHWVKRYLNHVKAVAANTPPFVGDLVLIDAVDSLLGAGVTGVIETGTFHGHTIRYLAEHHAHLPMITVELDSASYAAAYWRLRLLRNLRRMRGSSADVLPELARRGDFRGVPFFFLDAHWHKLPLLTEIRSVAREAANAVMLIHDFQVPGQPQFGFDHYGDRIVGLTLLRQGLATRPAAIYLPNAIYVQEYQRRCSHVHPRLLRGAALVFLGADDVHARFLASDSARFFTRHSDSLL